MRSRSSAAALLASAALALAAAPAIGARETDPADRPAQGSDRGGDRSDGAPAAADDGLAVGGEGSEQPRAIGTVNPLAIKNPFCDERLERAERRNCRVTGTPEGRYPTSNYGIDVHIDTGLDNIVGNFQALLAQIANAIWQATLFVLNLILTLLGWAFGLNPFSDNETMREIDGGLGRFYDAFTAPWLVFAMVTIGVWGLWRGLVRREVSASIAGTLLSVGLMICALWVLNEPRDTVGKLSAYSNAAALSVLAAPQGGVSNPTGTYAEATSQVWNDMTIPGFSALNFSDAEWALSAPDPELVETANKYVCVDAAYLAQIPPKRWAELQALDDAGAEVQCEDLAATLPAPRTNAELYLRSSPGSLARQKLWEEHADDAPYSSYFAIQGDGGAWTRLPLVVLIALGLLGGVCLLAWLALRLLVQTAVAFVLVLMTPLALFLPAFGEKGRSTFVLWGGTLAGALIAKLVYAALLSVILFATTVIASLVDDVGAMVAFLVMAGLWWAVFLKRESLISFMSVSDGEPGDGRLGSGLLGLYGAAQLGQRVLSPVSGPAGRGVRAGRDGLLGAGEDRAEATGRVAGGQLNGKAAERLDAQLEGERGIVSEQAERRSQVATLAGERTDALGQARRHAQARRGALERAEQLSERRADVREEIGSHGAREEQARSFIAGAEERERTTGRRWSAEQLGGAREAIRSEVDRPIDDGAHAWRVGMTPERYRALSGRKREDAYREVGGQLRSDRTAFGAIPDRPDGIAGRRGRARYRSQALARPGGAHALHQARRDSAGRRRRARRAVHRGVSR